jgi:hypothetical protein
MGVNAVKPVCLVAPGTLLAPEIPAVPGSPVAPVLPVLPLIPAVGAYDFNSYS